METGFPRSILMPLFADPSEAAVYKSVSNAITISRWLGSELHFIVANGHDLLDHELSDLGFDVKERASMIHLSTGDPFSDILSFVGRNAIDLLMFSVSARPGDPSYDQARRLLLKVEDLPVLLCPVELDLGKAPLKSLLVPLSGEPRVSASLEVALRLAKQMSLPVDLIHITEGRGAIEPSALKSMNEHLYHEYPKLIDQLILEESPYSGPRDRLAIRGFRYCCGDIAEEVLKTVDEIRSCLLVLEWKGTLASGRAKTVKSVLDRRSFPVLLVREVPRQRSILKVGNQFKAA